MKTICSKLLLLVICLTWTMTVHSEQKKKERYIPKKIGSVSDTNDYANPNSQFNYECMAESDNFVVFWDKSFGKDPTKYMDPKKRFNPNEFLKEGERFYHCFTDKLKFIKEGASYTDKYKMLLYIYNDSNATAYGWGADNIGIMWFRPVRIQNFPYCTLAHELGHAFQYMTVVDGGLGYIDPLKGSKGPTLTEMTSQWMLWQVYPDWCTIENYHMKSYLGKTHYALMHQTNMYHSPYMLEYWSSKHGPSIIGRIWRETMKNEDPVAAYKRITKINQQKLNAEIYDAATHFVTWDLPRIEVQCKQYANMHYTKLEQKEDNWFQIAKSNCPQNYGYNAIRLKTPAPGTKIELSFKGMAGTPGFNSYKIDKAGWRYGFLAVKKDGKRVYGKMYDRAEATVTFTVPQNTEYLWLIVTGAPTEHWAYIWDDNDKNDEEWPYRFQLEGTKPHSSM